MSQSSVRQIKERSGGAPKKAPSTAKINPVSGKPAPSGSTGKENSRSTSRIRAAMQKPNIGSIARIDNSAAPVEESRVRRSSSSVPRGRSSSPSEFTRALSDLRKKSRPSVGQPQKKVNSSTFKGLDGMACEKSDLKRVSQDLEKRREISSDVDGGFYENGKTKLRVLNGGSEKKERSLRSNTVKRSDLQNFTKMSSSELFNASTKVKMKSLGVGIPTGASSREPKVINKATNFPGVLKENRGNMYPSKLHERLAFLEGKVKRIASDIKRTKEILDMKDAGGSMMILSDIEEKISGIEKAMDQVVDDDSDSKMESFSSWENEDKKPENEVVDTKSLVKGLNAEELEASLFPHLKLIRNRKLAKAALEGSDAGDLNFGASASSLNVEEEKDCSTDGNAVALENLASLCEEKTRIGEEVKDVSEMDDVVTSVAERSSLNVFNGKDEIDAMLMADEKLTDFDDQGRMPSMIFEQEVEENFTHQLTDIGYKTSTGGWFVSEGESVLLAHDDGYCSFYDIANCEEKAEYKPPCEVSPNMWRDCWIIRAPSADGCSGRYVVAASAGNSADSGFCSWDFYTKDIRAFHSENKTTHVRTALAPLPNNPICRRNSLSTFLATESQQWWYKPCGPLIISTATGQKMVKVYDIRDGDQVMKWELQKPVLAMDYASPLQWRNRGKVVIAEADIISLWDVSSLSSQALQSVSSSGRKISTLHVNNTDVELGGGVRQRVSSAEAEGNDGMFCTSDSINILDFRHPSGVGIKIPKLEVNVQSSFSCGDSLYIGCTNLKLTGKKQLSSQIQQFSLRKQRLLSTYALPESNAHSYFTALTQVWGNSNHVMGVCGLGLFVFDSLKYDELPAFSLDYGNIQNLKETVGPDDMYFPSFDYSASRILLISRDRPAQWRYL